MAKKSVFSLAASRLTFHGFMRRDDGLVAAFYVLSPVAGHQSHKYAALPLSSLIVLRSQPFVPGNNAMELLDAEHALRLHLPLVKQADEYGEALKTLLELDRPGRPLVRLRGYGIPVIV